MKLKSSHSLPETGSIRPMQVEFSTFVSSADNNNIVEPQKHQLQYDYNELEDARTMETLHAANNWSVPVEWRRKRYILLTIYLIITIASGAILLGWPFMAKLFEYAGAYSWLCDDTNDPVDSHGLCNRQREAIHFLFTIGIVTNFVSGFLTGLVLHLVSPKFIGSVGASLLVFAFLMFCFSTQSLQLYIPGAMLMGGMIEMESFGILSVSNLFPKNKGLIISLIFGFSDCSWWIPMIMYYIVVGVTEVSAQIAFLVYGTFIALPCMLLLLWLLPVENYPNLEDTTMLGEANTRSNVDSHYSKYEMRNSCDSGYSDASLLDAQDELTSGELIGKSPDHQLIPYAEERKENMLGVPIEQRIRISDSNGSATVCSDTYIVNKAGEMKDSRMINNDIVQQHRLESKWKYLFSLQHLRMMHNRMRCSESYDIIFSKAHFAFCVYFGFSAMRNVFFNNIIEELLGREMESFLGLLSPFSCLPALFGGYLLDKHATYAVLLHNALSFVQYTLTLLAYVASSDILGRAAIVAFVSQNWIYTMMLSYLALLYGSSRHFGRAAATCYLVGGIMTFFCKYIHIYLHTGNHYSLALLIALVISGFFFAILGYFIVPHPDGTKYSKEK